MQGAKCPADVEGASVCSKLAAALFVLPSLWEPGQHVSEGLHFWDDQHTTRPLLPSCCLHQPQKYLCPGPWGRALREVCNLASLPLPPPGITGLQGGHGPPRRDFQRWESSESDKSSQIQRGALKSNVTNWRKGEKKKKTAKSKTKSSFWCTTIRFLSLRLIWIHHCWRGHILSLCLDKLLPSGSLLNWLFQIPVTILLTSSKTCQYEGRNCSTCWYNTQGQLIVKLMAWDPSKALLGTLSVCGHGYLFL